MGYGEINRNVEFLKKNTAEVLGPPREVEAKSGSDVLLLLGQETSSVTEVQEGGSGGKGVTENSTELSDSRFDITDLKLISGESESDSARQTRVSIMNNNSPNTPRTSKQTPRITTQSMSCS